MPVWFTRALAVAALALLPLTAAPPLPPADAAQTPDPPKPCSNKRTPPPPVDTSENPPPGEPAPRPLPLPAEPVGGERMGECRSVLPAGVKPPKKVRAASWIVADLDSGEVLAAKDPHGRQRPASLIKVLLALVVIDELDPDRMVKATKADANQECTCIGIRRWQSYSVDELFTSLLIRSGNDVAHALGTALGGVDESLRKMNELAERIGALDTRAASASGLDGPGMSSSAYDMALIFKHAMGQPRFTEAIKTREMRFRTHRKKKPITIYNDNRLLTEYEGFLGGKTGFTDSSRHTYVGAAERDGRRLVAVLLRSEQRPVRVSEQASRLLDYGFRLAGRDTEPVGALVDPPQEPDEEVVHDESGDTAEADKAAATGGSDSSHLIVALAVVVIGLAGATFLRRKAQRR